MKKTLEFGRYPMDEEGKEISPIVWVVFHQENDRLFLISQDILDYREFSNEENNNWDESPLKKWLNNEFFNIAFSKEEKAQMLEVDEEEKVSLMTIDQYNSFFPNNTKYLKAKYTDYARSKTKNIYGKVYDGTFGFYWMKEANTHLTEADLRSPTQHASPTVYVYHVLNRGAANGYMRANNLDGVRPIICIKK